MMTEFVKKKAGDLNVTTRGIRLRADDLSILDARGVKEFGNPSTGSACGNNRLKFPKFLAILDDPVTEVQFLPIMRD